MLGIDFSELGLIAVVALVVIGPTRLPGIVRKIGRWVGKARSMARDFQQQLENEVNLDELNRMTNDIRQQAQESTPAPPPEFSAEPPAQHAADSTVDQMAASGYPYGAQEAVPEASTEAAPVAPPDDTYSHAHAHGESPMTDEPPAEPDSNPRKDSAA